MHYSMNEYTLMNGVQIPGVGFGTWQIPDGQETVDAVKKAIEVGYRHIDTAAIYGNEAGVGQAIKECGVARKELFITSKLWNADQGYEETMAAFEETMGKLDLEYLDLYLIHWPITIGNQDNYLEVNRETWRAMEDLYLSGKIRAIGVCNFKIHHLANIMQGARVMPMVNQIEFHPGFMQEEVVGFCEEYDIIVEAWSPLGSGEIFELEVLKELAEKYQVSVAQVALQWIVQNGIIPLPKSVTPERIKGNLAINTVKLSEEDMVKIDQISTFMVGRDPDDLSRLK